MQEHLKTIFALWANEQPAFIEKISAHGSNRTYFRIIGQSKACLGAYNTDIQENEAFFSFSQSFKEKSLPVPEIYFIDSSRQYYLLEDLGDITFFHYLSDRKPEERFNEETILFYEQILDNLIRFQIEGDEVIDYLKCYPRNIFDEQCMTWDLNYFKYCFLKLANILFNEQDLETDFQTFISFLQTADNHYFLFRDFQSRNIMLKEDKFFFIDYQGGRRGPLQYDLASLLFDGKVGMPNEIRKYLLNKYIEKISQKIAVNSQEFTELFYGFVFMRIMQAFGTYGYRGIHERKIHFLKSIVPALENLKWLLANVKLPIEIPTLQNIWQEMCNSKVFARYIPTAKEETLSNKLTVSIYSFSYKNTLPIDFSGNGGGFVFDCRALPNPGKEIQYKTLTGKDVEVISFLEKEDSAKIFLQKTFDLVEQSVSNYLERGFLHLMVNFGCTGGQHRSVYCAEQLAKHLSKNNSLEINLRHLEQEKY